ncbi:MAG: radical SAM protein [Bacteroidales bacterium]|nr:radical SAM protein [Bacteroidales bacterium]
MKTTTLLRERHKLKNQEEYQVKYNYLRFVTPAESEVAETERREILNRLSTRIQPGYKGSKPDITDISPGCRICGEGTWSCLFINGVCNSRCFYCPAPQHDVHEPETNTLLFPEPDDYIDYLKIFKFRGMSISGGEPLLTFEKSLSFIRRARKEIGDELYIWLYTNGKLFDREKAKKLADAGVNEVRFDIGATDYNTDKVQQAIGIIPNVTVEIPAVPEEFELMKQKMRELKAMGVKYLNLHQLRLTPYNFNKLIDHDYTFIHGEKVTVLESELTALRLLEFSIEGNLGLPVNYCSFVYKNRYQKSAARRRHALKMLKPGESITESGFIRRLSFLPEVSSGIEKILFFDEETGDFLFIPENFSQICKIPGQIKITYFVAQLAPQPSAISEFKSVALNETRDIGIERTLAQPEIILNQTEATQFFNYLNGDQIFHQPEESKWINLLRFENIEKGLQSYY